jgi:N-acetylglucosaminyl-diphospho-decaprenol L-rhamnosyltransferase
MDEMTAVVLDWNLPAHAIRSVESLVDDGVPANRIVVVENGPTERTWTRIRETLRSSVLVRIDRNVGFAAAINLGAGTLPGSTYLFCNNDAFVHSPGSVAALLAELDDQGVAVSVPRLLNENGSLQPSVVPFTTPAVAAARASGLSRFIPNRWQPRWSTHWDHRTSRDVEAAMGAVIAVRADAWEQVGGFRETSFMYAEDIDLCWRLHALGWRTRFVADAEFVHLGGSSSSLRWSDRERGEQIGRAEAYIIREHLPPARAAAAIACMRVGLAARVVAFRLLGKPQAAESCRGSLQGLRSEGEPVGAADVVQTGATVEVVRPDRSAG